MARPPPAGSALQVRRHLLLLPPILVLPGLRRLPGGGKPAAKVFQIEKKICEHVLCILGVFLPFPRWWKRNVPPVESRAFEILMVVYNLVISLVCSGEMFFNLWKQLQFHIFENKPD